MAYPRRLKKPAAKKATTPRSSTRTKAALGALRKKARPAAKIAAPKMATPKRAAPKRAAPPIESPLKKRALARTSPGSWGGYVPPYKNIDPGFYLPAPKGARPVPMPDIGRGRGIPKGRTPADPSRQPKAAKAGRATALKKRSAKSAATELSRKRKSAAELRRKRAAQRRRTA